MQTEKSPPFIRSLHLITKDYFGAMTNILAHLDIERYYYCLILISDAEGAITQKDLTTQLDVDKVTMSRMVDYLVTLEYVRRETCEADRRTIVLKPTEKANRDMVEIRKAMDYIRNQAFKGLETDEIDRFLQIVDVVKANMAGLPRSCVKLDYSKINNKK